jgi:hypothetical protein
LAEAKKNYLDDTNMNVENIIYEEDHYQQLNDFLDPRQEAPKKPLVRLSRLEKRSLSRHFSLKPF